MKTKIFLIAAIAVAAVSTAFVPGNGSNEDQAPKQDAQRFTLPELPYSLGQLEPAISERTMTLHYGKHFQGYINNLNKLIEGTRYESMPLEDIVRQSEGAIFNNAGQTLNHTLYFLSFSPDGGGEPRGALAEAINKQWGSFEAFKKEFSTAAVGLFGSGWAWLSKDADGNLVITQEKNGGNPVVHGFIPIFGFDVWEHSYYLDYENRRADHIDAIWNILDWNAIGARF